jgi:SAM-dependent methyltransferase
MIKNKLESVVDIGCGSAYKLITYLGEYQTLGLELDVNVEKLQARYPDRKWQVSDFSEMESIVADVVICSDVIEHLVNPDELLEFIKRIEYKYLVLSTPDRGLIHESDDEEYFGPPRNTAHVREWTYEEFYEYISKHFNVIDHRVTNLGQYTQMIICCPK